MSFDDDLDRLYRLPLPEFVGARDDLAKRLRADGDRERAAEVKQLAKPSLTAWVVNQLHFQARPRLDDLLAAGEKIKAAIGGGPEAHRAATKARRRVIAELLALAEEILDGAGQTLSRVHRQRLTRTLEALAGGDPGAVPGRLDRDLDPPGFDALSDLAASLAAMPRRPPKLALVSEDAGDRPGELAEVVDLAAERQTREQKAREKRLAEARAAVAAAEDRRAELERRAGEARSALADAERREAEAEAAVDEAERRVREARRRLETATDATARARREADAAAARARQAGDRLAAAEKELRGLDDGASP